MLPRLRQYLVRIPPKKAIQHQRNGKPPCLMTDISFQSPQAIQEFQEDLLRKHLHYLAEKSPFYQRMFREHHIDVAQIRTIDDLQQLPFTEKADLQRDNADFLCVPPSEVIDYVTTSGTMGEAVTFACTDGDLERLAFNEARSFACAGVTRDSIVQIMTTLDKRFMAGMAYFLGLRRLGAGVVRVGGGIPELQWDTIRKIQPDTLMCVPSFILRLIDYAEAHGIDYRHSSVRRIIGIGEGLRDTDFQLNLLGKRIAERWPEVSLFATYSSTEMGATFAECPEGNGGHVHPELVIVEIIGEDNRPVKDGEFGEIVVTPLGVEGMPLLRFRTGDVAARIVSPCACGRHTYRLTPLVGRKHNMIKLKGTTLYPPALNDVLDHAPYVENYVVVARISSNGTDEVCAKVGLKQEAAQQYVADSHLPLPTAITKDLKDRFRARLRVTPDVEILPKEEVAAINFPPKSRKPIKFIDLRGQS